ncbi:MAG: beta-aspartyl-peptidase [Candidatus Aminicenantaceae bacterium]
MVTLVRGGEIFAPDPLGEKDIIILDRKIGAICEPGQVRVDGFPIAEVDASSKRVFPGFIDSHVHILGGGGEGGPSTRAPEITVEDIITSGVTTVIGCLGTDGTTRHMESLLAKANGLEIEGITTYIFSGSYQIPVVTLTGSIRSDIILIDKVIGAGEIAVSDHRSSQPTFEEFCRLASECRVGGMLGGKAGIFHCHLGDGNRRLEMFFRLIEETEIPITQLIPTHCNRTPELLEESIQFIQRGGYMDLTADLDPDPPEVGHISVATAIRTCKEKNAPLTNITISSDANGSLPVFDKDGNLAGLTIATQKSLLANFKYLIQEQILGIPETARLFSTNTAAFYKLEHKGKIKVGNDADLVFLDEKWDLSGSIAKGQKMMWGGELLVKGTFS